MSQLQVEPESELESSGESTAIPVVQSDDSQNKSHPEIDLQDDLELELEADVSDVEKPMRNKHQIAKENKKPFRKLGLNNALASVVETSGYDTPTPIQERTIPYLLEGRDVLGQAQTGTGKTAAFALPLLQRIDLHTKRIQVVVLTPTRELAIQVAEAFDKYAANLRGLRTVAIYGGQDYQIQFRQLNRGAHVVVGTPGRVMDHMRRNSLDLDALQCLVLDEADEMLRMGFAEDVQWVLNQSPKERQIALFSATMPPLIRKIAQKHLKNPAEIMIEQRTTTADTINQRYLVTPHRQKSAALVRLLEAEQTDGVLVFVKTRGATEPLADQLAQTGLRTAALNGDLAQRQRERIVDGLRAGKIDIIIATDVAARGLDVQRISHVINYDLPHDSEAYVHRIGRTGRAGRSGEAILFVTPQERRSLKRLEDATRKAIEPMEMPSARAINKQRVAKFHERITEALGSKELETYESIVSQYLRDNDVPVEKIAAALGVLANGNSPLLSKGEMKSCSFAEDSRPQRDSRGRRERGARGESRYESRRESNRDSRKGKSSRDANKSMATYRIEVGKHHRVLPGNIVGAIANEAGIDSRDIGRIKIFDSYSTVDLPATTPASVVSSLRDASIVGQKLLISLAGESQTGYESGFAKKPGKSANGKRFEAKSKLKSKKMRKKTVAK